jgi:hypothetical protein
MITNNLQKQKCPKCMKNGGLEIIYGAPTREEAERIKKGLAIPGGLRPESGPVFRWSCSNCGYVWGRA